MVGRLIVAGYDWLLTPVSIFVRTFLKDFYCKFNGILSDSLSLIKILEKSNFNNNSFLFTVDFKKPLHKHSRKWCYWNDEKNSFSSNLSWFIFSHVTRGTKKEMSKWLKIKMTKTLFEIHIWWFWNHVGLKKKISNIG